MKFFEELGVNKKATRQHPPRWGGTWGTNIKSKQNPCSGEHTLGWFEEHNRRWGFGKGGWWGAPRCSSVLPIIYLSWVWSSPRETSSPQQTAKGELGGCKNCSCCSTKKPFWAKWAFFPPFAVLTAPLHSGTCTSLPGEDLLQHSLQQPVQRRWIQHCSRRNRGRWGLCLRQGMQRTGMRGRRRWLQMLSAPTKKVCSALQTHWLPEMSPRKGTVVPPI